MYAEKKNILIIGVNAHKTLCIGIPQPGPKVIKLFSYSTQLSTTFQLLIKLKYRQIKKFLALSLSNVVFIMLINVKMPTIIGILTFMRRKNFLLSRVEHEKSFKTSRLGPF